MVGPKDPCHNQITAEKQVDLAMYLDAIFIFQRSFKTADQNNIL